MPDVNPYSSNVFPIKSPKPRDGQSLGPALKGGGGDGTSDGMDARLTALEKRFDKFEAKLDALLKDVAEVKGRVSALPTTLQMLGFVLAVLAIAGLAKFFTP
jgi:hypothetical protein